jgi:hypothetical protein
MHVRVVLVPLSASQVIGPAESVYVPAGPGAAPGRGLAAASGGVRRRAGPSAPVRTGGSTSERHWSTEPRSGREIDAGGRMGEPRARQLPQAVPEHPDLNSAAALAANADGRVRGVV